MPHQHGLPAALARFGLTVELVPGWETLGSASFTPRGSITHHTAGPSAGDRPSLNVCVNGRSDLPGPLCNVFLARSGVAVVVAAGRANHGGTGAWKGLSGNSLFFGTEAESAGRGDWTPEQLRAYPRIHAAYHSLPGMNGADHCCAHREYATPPGRKPDPTGIDMAQFRADVAALLADPTGDDMTVDEFLAIPIQDRVTGAVVPLGAMLSNTHYAACGRDHVPNIAEIENGDPNAVAPAHMLWGWAHARAAMAAESSARVEERLDRIERAVADLKASPPFAV